MDLSGIFTIGGKPGLHKLVAQSKNGIIVENLKDNKRMNAYASYKISSLEDISIFTTEEDLPLKEVFQAVAEANEFGAIEIPKEKEELRSLLSSFVANYDEDRVYDSDIKKIFSWYNLLVGANVISKTAQEETAQEEVEAPSTEK